MKGTVLLLCVALLIAGVAAAQDATAPPTPGVSTFGPRFEPGRDAGRVYPRRALEHGVSGLAFVCCTANPDLGVACRGVSEWPERSGFAAAGAGFFNSRTLTPDSYAALQAAPSQHFPIGMIFQIAHPRAELAQIAAQARERATDICGAGTGPAPEYVVVTASRAGGR